jgi:ABC-2 type transport system permease protein
MNYWKQVATVTRWEYMRFFKPKNEILGIAIMLIISVISYFATKYAFSDSGEKPQLTAFQSLDSTLSERLAVDFELNFVREDQISEVIHEITYAKEGILLEAEGEGFKIHAYKKTRVLEKLKAVLDEYHKVQEMQNIGLSQTDLAQVLSPPQVTETFIYTDNSSSRRLLAIIFAGLMIMAVFISFAYQFTAITGEKQLKITEQIVSAISPQVWMDGKIFGISLTGISSMFTYSFLGIIGGILFFQFKGVPIYTIRDYLNLPSIILFLPFALSGILLWNAILAAIASVITDPNNSGKSGLMMLPILFVMASFLVTRDPDSGLSVFLSWFPLTSASAMPMRFAITEVSFWQLAGSFLVLVATFYLLRKLAAKIFRVSILLSGKEPTWSEIFKLLKKS